jgi:hypothetical protein
MFQNDSMGRVPTSPSLWTPEAASSCLHKRPVPCLPCILFHLFFTLQNINSTFLFASFTLLTVTQPVSSRRRLQTNRL